MPSFVAPENVNVVGSLWAAFTIGLRSPNTSVFRCHPYGNTCVRVDTRTHQRVDTRPTTASQPTPLSGHPAAKSRHIHVAALLLFTGTSPRWSRRRTGGRPCA